MLSDYPSVWARHYSAPKLNSVCISILDDFSYRNIIKNWIFIADGYTGPLDELAAHIYPGRLTWLINRALRLSLKYFWL